MKWLILVRWPNLLFVLVTHVLLRHVLFPFLNIDSTISDFYFYLLSLSILGITASGNIINDIFDVTSDQINKRHRPIAKGQISSSRAVIIYITIVLVSLLLGIVFSINYHLWWLIGVEVVAITLLFLYAKFLKAVALLGNIIVSLLVSLSVVLVFLVELPLEIDTLSLYWIAFYIVFAFWTTLNREIAKDVSDRKGDFAVGYNTLPILIGKTRTNSLLFFSTAILIICLVIAVKKYLLVDIALLLYFTFVVCAPLGYVIFHIYKYEERTNYNLVSTLYKIAMALGIFSMILLIWIT
jgi:4-hydroxybenzoate polyprenyltransferase